MSINATLIAQALVFLILVWFTMKYIWPPIVRAMDERAKRIAEGLDAADRARKELAEAARQKATAQADIENMAHRARAELRGQVATLAVQGAEKILGREVDASTHKALLDELVAGI